MIVENIVFRSSTGKTGLLFSDAFLDVSYSPRKKADTNASISHMVVLFWNGKDTIILCPVMLSVHKIPSFCGRAVGKAASVHEDRRFCGRTLRISSSVHEIPSFCGRTTQKCRFIHEICRFCGRDSSERGRAIPAETVPPEL